MLVGAFCYASCLRDRGCSAHPVFPAPSYFKRDNEMKNSGRIAPRECEVVFAKQARRSPTSPACGGGRRARRARRVGEALSTRRSVSQRHPHPNPPPQAGEGEETARRAAITVKGGRTSPRPRAP